MPTLNIILCGLPLSGKTSLGKKLAKQLKWTFIDTDRLIEASYPQSASCREIYLKVGEEGFRALESQAIASLAGCYHSVIATGGGALQAHENRQILKSLGQIVYLQASNQTLLDRLQKRKLPATLDPQNVQSSWEALCRQRLPIFQETSDLILDTDCYSQDELIAHLTNI